VCGHQASQPPSAKSPNLRGQALSAQCHEPFVMEGAAQPVVHRAGHGGTDWSPQLRRLRQECHVSPGAGDHPAGQGDPISKPQLNAVHRSLACPRTCALTHRRKSRVTEPRLHLTEPFRGQRTYLPASIRSHCGCSKVPLCRNCHTISSSHGEWAFPRSSSLDSVFFIFFL
jgi:hypothetical protein